MENKTNHSKAVRKIMLIWGFIFCIDTKIQLFQPCKSVFLHKAKAYMKQHAFYGKWEDPVNADRLYFKKNRY